MFILKNAFLSIRRNKIRNILIGIVMVVISCAATISLAIQSSSKSLIEAYENQYQVEATISVNRENMMSDLKDFDPNSEESQEEQKESLSNLFSASSSVTKKDVENYGNSKYVSSYYYTESLNLTDSDIEKASTDSFMSSFGGANMPNMGGFSFDSNVADTETATNEDDDSFSITGYSSVEAMEEFISGTYKITDGSVSLDDKSCLLNSELASLNDLSVGDTLTFEKDGNKLKLKIVGIFEETSDSSSTASINNIFSNSANTIITSADTIETFAKKYDYDLSINPTFILKDKDSVDAFTKEIQEKGLNENLTVSTNLDQVENATSTISNVSRFAFIFLLVTLGIGAIILLVINMITIRERKYEIGVLRTIGMKKSKVAAQFICELFLVSTLSLCIGAGIGACTSVPVSNYLLESQIKNSSEQMNDIESNFGDFSSMPGGFSGGDFDFSDIASAGGIVQVSEFESIDATVNLTVLVELFGIGLLLVLISSSAALISIQRFKPLDILKERS